MRTLPLLLALTGCYYVDDARFFDQVQDADGDGGKGDRFGGPDCVDDDPSVANCDADGDGFLTTEVGGDDCDDGDDTVVPGTPWYADVDGDGFGDVDVEKAGCGAPPPGWSLSDADCDDASAAVNPTIDERCDPVDRNCDGDPYALASDGTVSVYVDADGDGYGQDGTSYTVCAPGKGEALQAGDCEDDDPDVSPGADEIPYDGLDADCDPSNENDADEDGHDDDQHGGDDCDDEHEAVHPAATELCDGLDNDCNGLVDDAGEEALTTFHQDADGDGAGDPDVTQGYCAGSAPDGWVVLGDDCNDALDSVHPGAVEWCNGFDDNCNKVTDEGTAVDAFTAYFDNDGDGWGGQGLTVCDIAPIDYDGDKQVDTLTLRGGDCGNNDPDVHPGATEICGDSLRQDCSDADPDDCDSDGYLAHDAKSPDCDDDPSSGGSGVHPGQKEVCDGLDNDCDGLVDAADPDVSPTSYPDWYLDADSDGHGSPVPVATKTCSPPTNAASVADDCYDLRSGVYPGAEERCDGFDNDCNKLVDDDPIDIALLYQDDDGDGYGTNYAEEHCAGTVGWARSAGDCDDADALRSPRSIEQCGDAIDNDCDLLVDGADPGVTATEVWYPDDDGDRVGVAPGVAACGDPSTPAQAYSRTAGDCDDTDANVRGPGVWFADLDGDTFGGTREVRYGCEPPVGTWTAAGDDCNDAAKDVSPAASELCNLRDDDCDGYLDESPTSADPSANPYYTDSDGDGFGTGTKLYACFDAPNQANVAGDCDDTNAKINPVATDTCGDGVDQDCSGTDATCTTACTSTWTWPDGDGDKFGSMAVEPVPGCAGVAYAEDCSDGSNGGAAQFFQPVGAVDLTTIVPTLSSCVIVHLTQPSYNLSGPLSPAAGQRVTIVADSPGILLISPSSKRAVDVNQSGSQLVLQGVTVRSASSPARIEPELMHVNTGARLLLVDTQVLGQGWDAGVFAQGGYLGLFGTTFQDMTSSLDGSAFLTANATFLGQEVQVLNSTATSGNGSITLDASVNPTLEGLYIQQSAQIKITGGTASNHVTLTDVESWDSTSAGVLFGNSPATFSFTNVVIARPFGFGLDGRGVSTGPLALTNATVVAAGGAGLNSAGIVQIKNAILMDNAGTFDATSSLSSASNIDSSWIPRIGGAPQIPSSNPLSGAPSFVTYNKLLPHVANDYATEELWDLHLRPGSIGRGAADDAGGYAHTDKYYEDLLGVANGVYDGWELRWFGGQLPNGDIDVDGLQNKDEFLLKGTCPRDSDTDGDGQNDMADTSPLDPSVQ